MRRTALVPHCFKKAWHAIGVLLFGCALPTDHSGEVFVTIDAPSPVLVRGRSVVLRAHAWVRGSSPVPVEIPGASFRWSSSAEGVAHIDPRHAGVAVVTGINAGRSELRASIVTETHAASGAVTVRVGNALQIDSVRPSAVRYGQRITMFGLGMESVTRATLGEAALIPDTASLAHYISGESSLSLWVPFPATSDRAAAVGADGGSATSPDSIVVTPMDIYDDFSGGASIIDLDGPPITSHVLFYNPALFVNQDNNLDPFRIVRSDTTRPLSIRVSAPAPLRLDLELRPSLQPFGQGWALSVSRWDCRGRALSLDELATARTIVRAYWSTPAPVLDLEVVGDVPGRYTLEIIDDYASDDPRVAPDRFEDNEDCTAADRNAAGPALSINLAERFDETLTIDTPFDVDWYRFSVPLPPNGEPTQPVTITWRPRLFSTQHSDFLVMAVAPADLGVRDEADWLAVRGPEGGGSSLSFEAAEGDYYLLMADQRGQSVRYAMCMTVGAQCSPADAALP